MVIQHNMSASNAGRMLGITGRGIGSSAEKLTAGYKINRAADDAAGLSISEKMRKKIRGLEKGMKNVQDGISFCQVADGALNEVADMLQRVRELSIQAYNGTNSKNDRHIIQEEVGECIDELDRVFETTKFNEIYIFRNGQRVQGDVYHTEAHMEKAIQSSVRDIPAWLKINDVVVKPGTQPKIEPHPGYLSKLQQDTSQIMKHDFKLSNGSYAKVYYGNDQGTTADGYQWAGDFIKNTGTAAYAELMQPGKELYDYITKHLDSNGNYTGWTATFSDNATAKIDFSEYAGLKDAGELYSRLSDLVGVELAFPCGTCHNMEAVRFSGSFIGFDNLEFFDQAPYYVAKKEINLSQKDFLWNGKKYAGYFDAITDVMAMDDADPDKAVRTTDLAKAVAADLAQSTYNVLGGAMTTHYDRALMDGTDPYSVYIYDYRDKDSISADSSVEALIRTSGSVSYAYEAEVLDGYYTHYDRWEGNPVWIQASDEVGDGISIRSGYLSADWLKLGDYRVDTYISEIEMEDDDSYQKRLAAWMAAVPEPKVEVYTASATYSKIIKPAQFDVVYENGEKKTVMTAPAVMQSVTEDREFCRYIYDESAAGPRPVRNCTVHEKYEPSELSLVDDAIAAVSSMRSYYGAIQNRLEHTYNNNYNADENLTYAESRIRDTDMADEMVRNSLLNILQQAGLSMLSQANQMNQGVHMLLS